MSNRKKRNSSKENVSGTLSKKLEKITAWVIGVSVIIIPLFVRLHIGIHISPHITFDVLDTGIKTDFFTTYKWNLLVITGLLAAFLFAARSYLETETIKPGYINLPVLIIIVIIMLSLITSSYLNLALFGDPELREGVITTLIYFLLFFVASSTAYDKKIAKTVFWGLGAVVLVNAAIGMACFFGLNLVDFSLIKWLLVPSNASKGVFEGYLPGTLSNPNYISGFSGPAASAFLVMALLTSKMKTKVVNGILSVLAFVLCITSLSTSGFMVVYVLVPLILVFCFWMKPVKQVLATFALIIGVFLITLYGMGAYSPRVWEEAGFDKVVSPDRNVNTVNIKNDWPGKEFGLPKPGLSPGSGRLYIWEKTVELISQRPLLGYGAGSYGYYFPQGTKEKVQALERYNVFCTKPHNFYLAFAFNYGIPALLALLALFFMHFVKTIKFIIKHKDSEITPIILALFVFWLGFLLQWLVNDSVIGTSVVFWVLFGMAVSMMRQTEEAEAKPFMSRGRQTV